LPPHSSNTEKGGLGWTGLSSIPLSHSATTLKQKLQILTNLISKNEHLVASITSTTLIIDFCNYQLTGRKGEKSWSV
jgi:hypothetical protein